MAHTLNPITWETQAVGSKSKASLAYITSFMTARVVHQVLVSKTRGDLRKTAHIDLWLCVCVGVCG